MNTASYRKDIYRIIQFDHTALGVSMQRNPETVTVTFKTKWLWLALGIVLVLIAVSPVVYSALPATSSPSSSPGTGGGSGSGSGPSATPNCANPCTIIIQNSLFGTVQPIIVKSGTAVIWINKDDTQHTTTSDQPGLWDSKIMAPGKSFTVTFNSTGTFTYHCNVHPMTGTIEVVS
jgi:hypothetical protein